MKLFCLLFLVAFSLIYCSNSEFDQNFLWGTYKPYYIHAISQRNIFTFNPTTIKMIYYNPDNLSQKSDLKSLVTERSSDDIIYDYEIHDGKNFAIHRTIDPYHDLNMTNTFIKFNSSSTNQTWVSKTKNHKYKGNNKRIGIIFSVALENFNQTTETDKRFLKVENYEYNKIITITDPVKNSKEFLSFKANVNGTWLYHNTTNNHKLISNERNFNWKVDEIIFNYLNGQEKKLNMLDYLKNIFSPKKINKVNSSDKTLFYINYIFNTSDEFEVILEFTNVENQQPIFSENKYIQEEQKEIFNYFKKYNKIFGNSDLSNYSNKNFLKKKQSLKSIFEINCGSSSLSNLLGGLLFTYGNLSCVSDNDNNCKDYLGMLSHTPSRLGFPRPFMWDEGFHNYVTCRWEPEICIQSIRDWLGTMNSETGWIPREQARGPELRSFIEWLKEDNREANPPTFLLDLLYLMENNRNLLTSRFTQREWAMLKIWYNWWYSLQGVFNVNGIHENLFKWWGPNPSYNLGSGMDDFPRNDENFVSKYNIDASVWGYFFTHSMLRLSFIYETDSNYQKLLSSRVFDIKKKIFSQLLDNSDYIFKDKLIYGNQEKFSPHLGYPNLFPFLFGLVDKNSKELDATLKLIYNENSLWTPFGIRSLDLNNKFFGRDSNYWRGPIWININYMILRALKIYYAENKLALEIYEKLRNNLIRNICTEKFQRGYFFEHFNQNLDGRGAGNHPFNGWTSLITLIISEGY